MLGATKMRIITCSQFLLKDAIRYYSPEVIIRIFDSPSTHIAFTPPNEEKLLDLFFEDIDVIAPAEKQVFIKALDKLKEFLKSTEFKSILIQCTAGKGRSVTIAYMILCEMLPHTSSSLIATKMAHIAPEATPNRGILEVALSVSYFNNCCSEDLDIFNFGNKALSQKIRHFDFSGL